LAVLAVVAVSAAVGALRIVTVESSGLTALATGGGSAEVTAQVATEPRPTGRGWWAIVRAVELDRHRVRERALLRGEGDPPVLGTTWQGTVTARPLGREGFDAHLRRLHAGVELRPASWEQVAQPGRVLGASERVRANLRTAARALPDPHAGIAVGIVTGDRRLLPPATERAMRDTGLTHLIVVSGAKLAIVVAGVLLVTRALQLDAVVRRPLLVAVVAWYVVVSRWEPSVLRAALMVAVLLVAGVRGQLGDARHGLAAAVLVLVLVDPGLAGSAGLLLSAGATAGVLVIAPLLQERSRLPGRVGALVAVTVGAQIGVAAPLIATFGELPVAAVPANVVAVPLVTLASIPVFAATLLGAFDPVLGVPLVRSAGPLLGAVAWTAETFRGWGGHIAPHRPVTLVAATAASAALLSRRATSRRAAATVAVIALLVAGAPSLLGTRPPPGLTLTAIDVGQGDAFLVESPRARVLVDGGPGDTAARWLRSNGRRRIDLVIATHAHADHVAGLPHVLARVRTAALWLPEVGIDRPVADEVLEAADANEVPVHHPVAGETAEVGDLRIEVLGPPPGQPYRWSSSELNDASIVTRVVWRDRAVLLTGDIEEAAQRTLLGDGVDLRAGAFTVPHHGAGTSLTAFLDLPGASIAVISAGEGNPHGHPHPETIATLEDAGIIVRRTDTEGTVSIRVPAPADAREGDADRARSGARPRSGRRRLPWRDGTTSGRCGAGAPPRRDGCGHLDRADPPGAASRPRGGVPGG
jgi:competence protein ComEC